MTLALHANLSYRLSVVGFLLGRQTAQIYARHGLAVQQWKVLSVLFHHAPMTAVEIERWVTLDKSAISRAVAQLRRAGLVERRLRAEDARSADILLTDAGRQLSRQVTDATAALQERLLQPIPAAGRQQLFAALDTMETLLRQAEAASQPQPQARTQRAHEGDAT